MKGNVLGVIALILWVIEPFIVDSIKTMPLFLLLSITFGTSFLISSIYITKSRQWPKIFKQPLSLFLAGICGVWLSDMLYIYAARLAPIAYVEFVDYIWPPLFVIFAILSQQHKFCIKELIAHIASMIGLLLLLDVDLNIIKTFSINYPGYAIALLGAMLWAGFLTYSKSKPDAPNGMIGIYAGIGAMISLFLHFKLEASVGPINVSSKEIMFAVMLGLTGFGLAYQFWDYGIKHGNIAWLSQANYLSRVLGIVLLFVFTKMPITSNILVGSILIIISFIAANWQFIKNRKVQPLADYES